ncbi:MAG: Flp family type IVb pilin [Pseudolabrys sp.]|jgi:Flp pilus assembly pilin Flp
MEREQNMSMRRLISLALVRRFLRAQDGTTAIEYAIIASGISIAIAAAVTTIGSKLSTDYYGKLLGLL